VRRFASSCGCLRAILWPRRNGTSFCAARSSKARRPGYATAALAAGVPAKVVSERLGHATIAITTDTYSHVLPGLDELAAGTVARLILGDGDQPPARPIDKPLTTGRQARATEGR
jgi:hypothetical protein